MEQPDGEDGELVQFFNGESRVPVDHRRVHRLPRHVEVKSHRYVISGGVWVKESGTCSIA